MGKTVHLEPGVRLPTACTGDLFGRRWDRDAGRVFVSIGAAVLNGQR